MPKQQLLVENKRLHYITVGLVVLVVAAIGTYFLVGSRAATPTVSLNADSGTLSSGATIESCAGSSDGSCVVFGSTSTGGSNTTINASPDGPATPSGGWSVAYADAFNEPFGTGAGQDNTLYPNGHDDTCGNTPGFNSDEMEVFNCSAVSVNSNGLNLNCSYTPGVASNANYTCGTVQGDFSPTSGYKFFGFKPGEGQEWAVETTAKLPPNTGEADPGWWATGGNFQEELDFFEEFGTDGGKDGSWTTANPPSNGWIGGTDPTWIWNEGASGQGQVGGEESLIKTAGFDPSAGFHTYTTVFFPDGSFSEYIDGKIQAWDYVPSGGADYKSGGTVAGPPAVNNNQYIQLLLSYALRDGTDGNPDPYFTSGTRDFNIRSIAVYENTSANGANAQNTGLAPGTTIN